MKPFQKIKLIDDIAIKLQATMSYSEIDSYFSAYGIPTNHQPSYNSKKVYVKEVLPDINNDIIIQIANELNIEHNLQTNTPVFKENTTSFWKTGHFKLFISHLSTFKITITHLKKSLEQYGISSFVAHEDIEPTTEWQEEIEKGLFSMDALCAVLMPGFKESNWTDQEIGIAIGRGVLVIPIRRELDPYGFIGKYQGFQASGKSVEEVAYGIFITLTKNPKTRNKIISCLTDLFLLSTNTMEATERINALKKINDLPIDKITKIKNDIIENINLKDTKIIALVNELIKPYNIGTVTLENFEFTASINVDQLPF